MSDAAAPSPSSGSSSASRSGLRELVTRAFPVTSFVGGFVFDVVSLGFEASLTNLLIVAGYALLSLVFLWIETRPMSARAKKWLHFVTNFFIGSVFSALVVLYFRSAGSFLALLIVTVLFALMVWNEFFRRHDAQHEIVWSVYAVSLVMLANFLLPYAIGTVSPWSFYASTVLAVGVLCGLRWITKEPWKNLRAPIGAAIFLVGAYALGAIPPVPLVAKHQLVCTEYEHIQRDYTCTVQPQSWLTRIGLQRPVVKRRPGEPIHVLTAVYAPPHVDAGVEHRWWQNTGDGYVLRDTLRLEMSGGRKDGWRFQTRKRNVSPGRWKVETALSGGNVIAYEIFDVEEVPADAVLDRKRVAL